jgi:nucleoside 2-deoxyribosyltransferase
MKTIVISGSIKKAGEEIEKFAKELEDEGFRVIYPKLGFRTDDWDKLSEPALRKLYKGLTIEYFDLIERADAVFIYNKDGYCGNSVTMELAYAYAMRKPIYALMQDQEISRDVLFDGYANNSAELIKLLVK